MKYYRSLPLAAVLSAALALPALAQTAASDASPAPAQAGIATPLSQPDTGAASKAEPPATDTGVKKLKPQTPRRHRHHAAQKTRLKTA